MARPMTYTEAKNYVGEYGEIQFYLTSKKIPKRPIYEKRKGEEILVGFKPAKFFKEMHGTVTEVDQAYLLFKDNHGHIFMPNLKNVYGFTPKKFKPVQS